MAASERQGVAVIGVGRMGHHHVRKYAQMDAAELLAVVDPDGERAEAVADEFGCLACTSVQELLERFGDRLQAVSVAAPTSEHVRVARPLVERGVACLIEKPMASTAAEARELAALAQKHNAVIQVGHTERFNPAVRAVGAMGIRPRFIEVDRVSPMSFRSLDVGVVMDMMIHDLDIVLMLAGADLARVEAVGVSVLGEHEDVCSARLVFASGCVANLTASRLALKTERKMRIFSEDAYVSLDYQKRGGLVIRRSENELALEEVRQQLAAGADLTELDYSELVSVDELTMDLPPGHEDQLAAELSTFLQAVGTGGPAMVDARAGYQAVEAAERVVQGIAEHRWEGLDDTRLKVNLMRDK